MTVREIIKEYLDKNGFDGLCNDDCGCGTDDLAPCLDGPKLDCNPAYKNQCGHEGEKCNQGFEQCFTQHKMEPGKCWMED
jgi:hypothetical protein